MPWVFLSYYQIDVITFKEFCMIIISSCNVSITHYLKVPRCHIMFEDTQKKGNLIRTPKVF